MRAAAQLLFPIPDCGLERRLPRITAPPLLLWGREDRFMAPRHAELFRNAIPNAHLAWIERAGHAVGAEQPRAYADAVRRFVG